MSVSSLTRLGTADAYGAVVQNLETRQTTLSQLQQVISSGNKITTPASDPTGAAQAERALTRIARIATQQRALNAQTTSITAAESTLSNVTSALQQIRDLVAGAGNATYTSAQRQTVSQQITNLGQQVLNLANTTDSSGQPLFAGLGSALQPFVAPGASSAYTFNGLPGTAASSAYSIPGALDGASAFMLQPSSDASYNVQVNSGSNLNTSPVTMTNSTLVNGSSYSLKVTGFDATAGTVTYDLTETTASGAVNISSPPPAAWTATGGFSVTDVPVGSGMAGLSMTVSGTPAVGDTISVDPNSSVFSTISNAATSIANAANSTAATQAVTQALHNIDISLARVSNVQGQAGNLLNVAANISSTNDSHTTQQQTNLSNAQDANMVQSISLLQNQQTGYQAALQSYAQIQKLSLFTYIG